MCLPVRGCQAASRAAFALRTLSSVKGIRSLRGGVKLPVYFLAIQPILFSFSTFESPADAQVVEHPDSARGDSRARAGPTAALGGGVLPVAGFHACVLLFRIGL